MNYNDLEKIYKCISSVNFTSKEIRSPQGIWVSDSVIRSGLVNYNNYVYI